jgi:hypothetical protein
MIIIASMNFFVFFLSLYMDATPDYTPLCHEIYATLSLTYFLWALRLLWATDGKGDYRHTENWDRGI